MNHKTDMHEALQLCIDAMLHDGVPTDPYHPRRVALNAAEAALAFGPDAQADERGAFQSRVHPWMLACFGSAIAADTVERNHRFFEEASELVQACGMTASEAHQLIDYTWSRPIGEKAQEVGGAMVTLAALCLANGLDMHAAGETELARISAPETMAKIRAKQAAKPKHSPLPEARAAAPVHGERGAPTLWEAFEMGFGLRSAMLGHVLDGRDVGRLTTCDFWHPALHGMHVEANLHVGLTVGEAIARLKNEVRRRLDALVAAAPQAEAAQGVPEGYALVPIEPTPEMVKAGSTSGGLGMDFHEWMGRIKHAWRHMLAAAPSPDREQAPYSAPFTTDVPHCCGEPETCNDPCGPSTSRDRGEQACPHGVDDGACGWCYDEATRGEQGTAEAKCKACNGNDSDMPCAYPEGRADCLRNASAPTLGETVQGKPMATTAEFDVAIETLRHVIECLRNTGRYTDEEGEATDFLEPLLYAHLSAPQPQAVEPKGMTDERVAFETWQLQENGWDLRDLEKTDGRYNRTSIQDDWHVWQGARALLSKGA